MGTLLLDRAAQLEAYCETHLRDPHGALYAGIHADTLKPWTANDLTSADDVIKAPPFTAWEILNYENTGMVTGGYLAAMSYKFGSTNSPDDLSRARRAFEGLRWVYELGRSQEEGFFPKTYGGRISHEISTDQYLYAIKGMMAYLPIAPADDAALIRQMVPAMVQFWVNRGYRYDYFDIKDMLWPLGRFPSLLLAAYTVSGDEKFLAESQRINREHQVYKDPADSQLLIRVREKVPLGKVEQRLGNRYLGVNVVECAAMDLMELDECLQHSNEHRDDWLRSMQLSWKEGKLGLLENGLSRFWTLYDPATGQADSPEPQFTGEPCPIDWSFLTWIGKYQSPRSVMLARVGVHVAKWLPNEQADRIVNDVLSKVGLEHMYHMIDPDGKQIRPEHKYNLKLIDSDCIVNWLWAYWQGRFEGVVKA